MLRTVLNIPWKGRITDIEHYGNLPKLSNSLRERRRRFKGHVWSKTEETAQKLLLWEPAKGKRKPGRPGYNYVDQLKDDTGLEQYHLKERIQNREQWREHVKQIPSF